MSSQRERLVRTDDGWQRRRRQTVVVTSSAVSRDHINDVDDDETRRLREHLRDAHVVVADLARRLVMAERALQANYC